MHSSLVVVVSSMAVGDVRVLVVAGTGSTVGLAVGFWVGLGDGCAVVGLSDGLDDGLEDGLGDGLGVGLSDGIGVASSSTIISLSHSGTRQLTGHLLSSSSTSSSSMSPNSTKAWQCNFRCCAHPIPNLDW